MNDVLSWCVRLTAVGISIGIIYGVLVLAIKEVLNIFKLSSK